MHKDRRDLVTLTEATELLGLSDPTVIINGEKYKRFYHPVRGRKNMCTFDIKGYRKWEQIEYGLIEKTKLFVEWLIHERGFTTSEIAKKANISNTLLRSHMYSWKTAYKISKSHKGYIPAFDKYYGWK